MDLPALLKSPEFWIIAAITGIVGNTATALAAAMVFRLFPYVAQFVVPAARVLVIALTVGAWGAFGFCALTLPPGFRLSLISAPPFPDIVFPVGALGVAFLFAYLSGVFGQRIAPIVAVVLITALVAWLTYFSVNHPPTLSSQRALWLALWGYSLLEPAIIVGSMLPIAEAISDRNPK
jgi:hypothetical protein